MIRSALAAVCGLLFCVQVVEAQAVRTVAVRARDLAFSPLTGRLYASVFDAGTIVEIDPIAGTVGASFPVGNFPNRLAMSDTGEYLYVGLDGLPGVVRVHLPTRTVGTPFPLGAPDPTFGPRAAQDMLVLPGNPDAVVIARRLFGISPSHDGVAVYDNGVQRPVVGEAFNTLNDVIAFGTSSTRLYGYNISTSGFGFQRMEIGPTGVTILESTSGLMDGAVDIEQVGGRVFGTNGRVVDGEALTLITTLPIPPGLVTMEVTADAVYYLTTGMSASGFVLRIFDPASLSLTREGPLADFGGYPFGSLVGAGPDRLAVPTRNSSGEGPVLIITPSVAVPGPPQITITGPTAAATLTAESFATTLTGLAADNDGSVTSVTWTSSRGFSGTANGTTLWTAGDVPLLLGSNVVTVTAIDSTGNSATDTIDITVAAFSSILTEGATGDFFDYDLALANPSLASVDAAVSYFTPGGGTVTQSVTLPAWSRRTIRVDDVAGLGTTTMSTSIRTTTAPIVVERTMRWSQANEPQYGAHTDKATAGTATTWYFAEGSQGFFFTYLLLANPDGVSNTATIDWLIEGGAPVQRTVSLPPNSRTTIDAGADTALVGRSFGIIVTFAQPAVAERAMYFGTPPDVLFKAGHDSAGVTAPSTRWILAEGATGPFFETFILLANPNDRVTLATLRFLTSTGIVVERSVQVPARGRRTVNLEALSPVARDLVNAAVSTIVTATLPIIAERAQYWPGPPSEWNEAHNSFGLTAARTRWGLAEGRVGNPATVPAADYQTYILLANPGAIAATVTATFLRESGAPIVRAFTVQPQSRFNVAVAGPLSNVPELADEMFGALIESTQPIVVERALYGNAGSQVFGIGTNATGTALP